MPVHLTTAQQSFVSTIITLGQSLGATTAEMQAVRDIAFNESSFNVNTSTNPTTQATGPFQYTPGEWSDNHSSLDINSATDQVKAALQDVMGIAAMYYPLAQSNPSVYDNYSLSDYADAI